MAVGLPWRMLRRTLGIALHKARHNIGQHIARLRVGGGNGKRATIVVGEFIADIFDVLHIAQNPLCQLQHLFARCDTDTTLLPLRIKICTPNFFQKADLLGNARLDV